MFDSFVGSILSNSCEVWGFGKCKSIERSHLKFCKAVLKVKSSTCTLGVYGNIGRYPLYIQRYVRIIKFWCHIVLLDNILVTYFYNNMVEVCNKGATNWAGNVKSLLYNYGFSYVWNNPHAVSLSTFHLVFKERVIDDLFRISPMVLYKEFKSGLEHERYLDLLPYKLRIGISQFRLSANQLRIVTGRYSHNRIDRSMRLCTRCDRSDIEDEYHFVIICPAYSHLGQKYINPYYYRHPSVYKFILLMKSTKLGTLKK